MKKQKYSNEQSSIAWFLALIFTWSIIQPTVLLAGGGGPTQPESASFTPVGLTDMVNPFTGDFTYNIPLMDIEGYPINIAYNSGITMDQEASWVGLGWNLNAGAITRSLRGLPDDFNGDNVVKTQSIKPVFNIGIDAGLSGEIFGFQLPGAGSGSGASLSLNASLGFNNYLGFNASTGAGISFKLAKSKSTALTAGLSLSGSSENGASFSPSLGIDRQINDGESKLSTTIGTAYNSRKGLQAISYELKTKNLSNISANGSYDLGLAQYLPVPNHPKVGGSLALQFNISGTVFGADGQGNIGVSISRQWIDKDKKSLVVPSYGYLYHEQGIKSFSNQLDFNRDNDIPFSKYSAYLPSTFQTYDIFNAQAQGINGSFRPQRNDVSFVFDPSSNELDVGANIGVELGAGGLADIGVDVRVPINTSYTGIWDNSNQAIDVLNKTNQNQIMPKYTFVESSESSVQSDNLMTTQFFGTNLEKLVLSGTAVKPIVKDQLNQMGNIVSLTKNNKNFRELTNNQMYILTNKEVQLGLGVFPATNLSSYAKPHHISEITQLGQDGRRYIFAQPAYNITQEDVTFATGKGMYGGDGIDYSENNSGLIHYSGNDASIDNVHGIDNYYNEVKTPPYAHSYLLSAVLSDDYVDADAIQGPSQNDLGSYVRFDYSKVSNHKWRSPMNSQEAFYNEGMRTDNTDDKASFIYGEKELYYLEYIETKNYIAVFKTEDRDDGYSSNGRDGGFNSNNRSRLLRSISLYSKAEVNAVGMQNATPIKKVVFDYDYHLCSGYPANNNGSGGKLTLKSINFTYQNSKKMDGRGYTFDYSSVNPLYNIKSSDRWGTYKPNATGSETDIQSELNNAEYPYSEQDKTLADMNVSAWALTSIKLPSGGLINVTYESDDYQFVQHKRASQMFKIVGVAHDLNAPSIFTSRNNLDFVDLDNNPYLIFKMDDNNYNISNYVLNGQQLYFRALMEIEPNVSNFKKKSEFVSGYATVTETKHFLYGGLHYGAIKLMPEKLKDIGFASYSPLVKQAILLGRAQLSRTITDPLSSSSPFPPASEPSGAQGIKDFANALIGSIESFKELATGPNLFIYNMGKCRKMLPLSSWMRLSCPDGRKLGGGSRVKEIKITDNWGLMGGGSSKIYGQTFKYELEDGTSSGVASYEPQLGGDENTWHNAIVVNNKRLFAIDEKMNIENPIMESQFPNPSIGYSRVVITDLNSENMGIHGTGKIVKEYYTARDFPTIIEKTLIDLLPKNSFLPLLPKYQYLSANQGFKIELNDMHGKQKSESVYGQDQTTPLSTVEYYYKSTDLGLDGVSNKRLKNEAVVIKPDGSYLTETIGVKYDVVADFRESKNTSKVPKMAINSNTFMIGVFPLFIFTGWPGSDKTTIRFRSSTLNKTVQRFGILDKIISKKDGSIVETKNLAYDSQTGQVLITQTTTNFNDEIFSLNYPAYWKYKSFGQASKNILYSYKASLINNNGFVNIPPSLNYFTEGDEVSVVSSNYAVKAWVVEKFSNGIRLLNKQGDPIFGSNMIIKVLRSGYRNMQQTSMASMTSLDNPIDNLQTNQFSQVLNAGAVEFSQDWKTFCECFTQGVFSDNPYILGTKGNWRPFKSYTHLSGRTQTNFDGNTNIRKDGVFNSYSPFYRLENGIWSKDANNWTFVSEVTQFSPNGMTMETKDALDRYSSSLFSFNNTLTNAVASNAKMTQIASGSFEDLSQISCSDLGFFSKSFNGSTQVNIPSSSISTTVAHTGKTSIVVTPSKPLVFQNTISTCADVDTCNLTINCKSDCSTLVISGGNAPYSIESTPEGNATAELVSANQIFVTMDYSNLACKQTISITDSKGCKIKVLVSLSSNKVIQIQTINF